MKRWVGNAAVGIAVVGLVVAATACGDNTAVPADGAATTAFFVETPDGLAAGTAMAATDVTTDLGHMTGTPVGARALTAPGCEAGVVKIVVLGHEHDQTGARVPTTLAAQQYAISETRCGGGGHEVVVRGGSLLSAQWAAYDLMERLGVRYLHPEQTLYPAQLAWPADPIAVMTQPAFARRSLHAHTTHPIELSPPLDASPQTSAQLERDWVAWNVKVRHSDVDGFDPALIGTYAWDRGFPRGAGINLLETQQGGRPVIDPTDPRPEHEQISDAIDAAMADQPGAPPVTAFDFSFNPSEFTTADEAATVDRLTFVTSYIHGKWPAVRINTVNHGTAEAPGPVYGVRFFDLSQFAPPQLGVMVHPLMFYDLDRPAPVYGNADFQFLGAFIRAQQATRPIIYYPEASWWLTFDLPVPLYLAPVTLEARDHDLRALAPFAVGSGDLSHGVVGHHTFSSGQEWGYWLVDYCTARMTWDLGEDWTACMHHAFAPLADGDALADLLAEVGRAQVGPLRDPGILAMLVGSDHDTEAAAGAGIVFHPLPPAPAEVLGWSDDQVAAFRANSLDKLPAMAAQYAAWASRADAIVARQGDASRPWAQEVADGLRITGLRAAHAHAVYTVALALRDAIAARDFAAVSTASARVSEATSVTDAARAIVASREAAYRYAPELSIVGDEAGTAGAVPNATVYPYRYLSRTHRLFYWTRPDSQLAAMFSFDQVVVSDRMVVLGTAVSIQLLVDAVQTLSVAWGDGETDAALADHVYATDGVYDVTLDAIYDGGALHDEDRLAVVDRKQVFAHGSLHVAAPAGASIIEGLLPGYAVGLGTDGGGAFVALGQLDGATSAITRGTVVRRSVSGGHTVAADLPVPLGDLGAITVYDAVVTLADGSGATDRRLAIDGTLHTDEVISIVAHSGGFDPTGARAIVASTLGYTTDTLPATLPISLTATGTE